MENESIGEILLINTKSRTAIVFDEMYDRIIEVSLVPMCRDDNIQSNTWEEIPKEGTKVRIGHVRGDISDPILIGPAPIINMAREEDDLRIRRKLTSVNEGDPLYYGLITDDLSPEDGFTPQNGEIFGDFDPIYKKLEGVGSFRTGNSFEDMMPGDKIMSTKDGNALGVMEGGLTYLKASELCQIIGIRYDDLLRVVSRNYEHFTDFGNITIKNEEGAVNYVIEGAKSQGDVRAGRFGLRIEMGQQGDMYKCTVLDGKEGVLSQIHMKSTGDIDQTSQNFKHLVKGNYLGIVHGSYTYRIQGNYEAQVYGDYSHTVKGSKSDFIESNKTVGVRNDYVYTVGRNKTTQLGGVVTETVFGSPTGGTAFKRDIIAGDKVETITTVGNFKRETLSGNIEDITTLGNYLLSIGGNVTLEGGLGVLNSIKMTAAGGIELEDINGNKIEMTLSGIKIKEYSGATLNLSLGKVALGISGVELLSLVDKILVQLNKTQSAIIGHTHATVVGPTSPPSNAPTFAGIQSALLGIKSQLLTITGSV